MKQKTAMQMAEAGHELDRAMAARQQYIRWRMNDVPGVYTNLMPPTYDAATLWEAERAIRAQLAEDQKHLASPWRQIGPPSAILNYENLTAKEKIRFATEISIPVGMADAPKPGKSEHPEVLAALEAARQSPAFKKGEARGALLDKIRSGEIQTVEQREQAAADYEKEFGEPF